MDVALPATLSCACRACIAALRDASSVVASSRRGVVTLAVIRHTVRPRRYALATSTIALVNVSGYYMLNYLTSSGGDVSVFVPLVGLYIAIPPLYGE